MNKDNRLNTILEELEKDPVLVDYIYWIITDYTTYNKGEFNETV